VNSDLRALEAAGRRIGVGLIGAGQMGTDIVSEVSRMHGVDVVAVADLVVDRAWTAYALAGRPRDEVSEACSLSEAVAARERGRVVVTGDHRLVTDLPGVEVVIDATGAPEIGARAALRTIRHGRHLVMMNVETDITVGPVLNHYAERRGVVYTLGAGDEPVALKELYDFADALGLRVVAAGKGKNNPLDRTATPVSLAAEAARRGLTPEMLVEFVDGSKTMIEMAAVANATGLVPDVRGMHGPATTVPALATTFRLAADGGILEREGIVDYAVGPVAPGVFLVVTTDQPRLRECLVLRDMGDGPNYLLFRPFHLCSMEVPLSAVRAVLERRTTMSPLPRLVAEVFAVAKTDLAAGTRLDGIGGRHFYCLIDRAEVASAERLLPAGLAKGALVLRDVPRDRPLTHDDVELPVGSTVVALRRLQDRWAAGALEGEGLLAALDQLDIDGDRSEDAARGAIDPPAAPGAQRGR
jgi:predicted homoserine dehydrogenase-like protein